MTILELIKLYMPNGTDAFDQLLETKSGSPKRSLNWNICPTWPPDLFAVVGAIIEQSGCYTQATPNYSALPQHLLYLKYIKDAARNWRDQVFTPPNDINLLWKHLCDVHGNMQIEKVVGSFETVSCLLMLFAIADEVSAGIGWGIEADDKDINDFAKFALGNMWENSYMLPHYPYSFCKKVAPQLVTVLPKSMTASVGCTIRSLSHNLALLPPKQELASSWILGSERERDRTRRPDQKSPYDLRLLVVPFPFHVHADCFKLSKRRQKLDDDVTVPAHFSLEQLWLRFRTRELTGEEMAKQLFAPLIESAQAESGFVPDGIVLPECALNPEIARDLVKHLAGTGIEFLITGVLDKDIKTGKSYNRATTFVIQTSMNGVLTARQNKHHRWRLDKTQTKRYALNFDNDPDNSKWWEDIEVGERELPFLALRKDMSLATLICEDLARTDPAMRAIRSVGPNLVVALLMDGPQLATRWPGRYATVLADDPGSAVLSVTCAAMVDRSNWLESKPIRSIGLWRDANGITQEIGLPDQSLGVLLTLQSAKQLQHTLDSRSDGENSRQLTLRTVVPLFLATHPKWI